MVGGALSGLLLGVVVSRPSPKPETWLLDTVVFVADKIAWDGVGDPPYLADLLAALDRSLPHAALCYLEYLWARRTTIPVVHPWFAAALQQLTIPLSGA
jgi:HD superfamily phosphohydrolase YqeK